MKFYQSYSLEESRVAYECSRVTMNKDEPDICCESTRFEATKPNSPSLQDIQKEIGETEEARIYGLETLKRKVKELEDVEACLDDEFLLRFLRFESFDAMRALQRLKNFYDMQEDVLEMFKHCSVEDVVVKSMPYLWALPYRPKNNSALLVVTMGVPDFSRMTFDEKSYLDLIATNALLMNPLTQMCGVSLIFDWSGFHLSSFLAFKPVSIIRLMKHMLASYPMRIKEIHVVNIHSVFRIACNMFCFVLPKELKSCVFFHPNDSWKSLHGFIPPEILPQEYGGHLKRCSMINLLEDVEKLEKQFGELFRFGYVKTQNLRQCFRLITSEKDSKLSKSIP